MAPGLVRLRRWPRTIPRPWKSPRPDGFRLKALLFRPDGNGPFPAVVGLHNCTGLKNSAGQFGARYRDWGQHLVKDGFAVLMPDSNASRGVGSQCAVRSRSIRVDRERVADAEAARAWLQAQSWVSADRVSLLGWSSGAVAALWAVRVRPQPQPKDTPDFRSAVALYPGCRRLSIAAWSARVPTLILIGRADDQASAAACQQMVAGARGRSARVAIHVYPGAYHDFDHPEPAAAAAHRAGLLGGRHGPRAQRHQSGRARRCAEARAGVVREVITASSCPRAGHPVSDEGTCDSDHRLRG